MGEPSPGQQPSQAPSEDHLDSWKEIAEYLSRDVTTVQRWEKREGMPVHRHVHDKRGSVYALGSELDGWLQSRRLHLEENGGEERKSEAALAEDTRTRRVTPQLLLWGALGGLAVISLLAFTLIRHRRPAADAAPPKIRSLAVLPLENLSGDPAQEYLAEGMTDALIGRLSGIHDLRVISRTSVMRFRNPKVSAPEIAKALGVDALVEGSVIREGARIRVTAQLIRGATDEHFWSQTYDRELRDVLSLQSELAQSIANKVEVTVTGEEQKRLAAARSVAPEVYEDYLQGSFFLNRDDSRADIEKGMDYLQRAISEDAAFGPAYAGLAFGYSEMGSNFIGDPPDRALQKEMDAAQKALQLDPDLADAHVLLADVQERQWRWAQAEIEYRRALELNPNEADAYAGLAMWMITQGRTQEALDWVKRGRELNPLEVRGDYVAWVQFEARRYDQAMHELRGVLSVQPDDAVALWDLGIVLIDNHQATDAIPVLEKAVSASNRSPGVIGALIRAYAQAGRRNDALRLIAELEKRLRAGYVPAGAFVNAYLGLGENDQAFVWLDQACKEHSNMLEFLRVDPLFDPIRSDTRFAELLRRVGLDRSAG